MTDWLLVSLFLPTALRYRQEQASSFKIDYVLGPQVSMSWFQHTPAVNWGDKLGHDVEKILHQSAKFISLVFFSRVAETVKVKISFADFAKIFMFTFKNYMFKQLHNLFYAHNKKELPFFRRKKIWNPMIG